MLWTIFTYSAIYCSLYTIIFFLLVFFENKKALENPKLKKFYSVSVIVPAYNEENNISRTIESLLNLDYPKDKVNIFIIDDGSKDDTYNVVKKYERDNVKIFRNEKNMGKAKSLNFALKKIDSELVGCLDADSFVERDALKKIIGYFDNPYVMAVTPSLKVWKPRNFLQMIQRVEYLFGVFLRKVFSFLGSIHVTPGPFTIYRKIFFDKYGGYDESTLTEDIELALRLQSNNYIIENSIDANVYTIAPNNFKSLYKQRMRWYTGFIDNVLRYKHLFSSKYGNLGVFILPSSFVFVAMAIISFFYFLYNFLSNFFAEIDNLFSINFDFLPMIKSIELDSFYLYLSPILIFAILLCFFSLFNIYLGKKYSKDIGGIKLPYLFYFLVYWWLFAFWWLMASFYKFFSIDIKWGKSDVKKRV